MEFTYASLTAEQIKTWCIENNQVAWLKEAAKKEYFDKDGAHRNITFVDLKLEFVRKFFPDKAPKKTEKKPTLWEEIEAL